MQLPGARSHLSKAFAVLVGALVVATIPGHGLAEDRPSGSNGPFAGCIASRPALATTGRLTRTSQILRAGEKLTILAIGSSSTAGTGASSPAAAYPVRLA